MDKLVWSLHEWTLKEGVCHSCVTICGSGYPNLIVLKVANQQGTEYHHISLFFDFFICLLVLSPLPSFDPGLEVHLLVGYDEQISAIEAATEKDMSETKTHPQMITAGPPPFKAVPYRLVNPVRIETIENETEKLVNDVSSRFSSCL